MAEGTDQQLERVLLRAQRVGVAREVLDAAQFVQAALHTATKLRTALDSSLDQQDSCALAQALRESINWLQANPSDAAYRALPWSCIESARESLWAWQSASMLEALESAAHAQSTDDLDTALHTARAWLADPETGDAPQIETVEAAVSSASLVLTDLMNRASAAAALEALLICGADADEEALVAALECAETHEVDSTLIGRARELQAALAAAAHERRLLEERRKREAEAAAERERRTARQSIIENRRLSVRAEMDKRRSYVRAQEKEEDAAVLAAAGGAAASPERRGPLAGERQQAGSAIAARVAASKEMRDTNTPREGMSGVDKSGWLCCTAIESATPARAN